MVDTQPTSM